MRRGGADRRGFTLIEMLAVLLILTILFAFLINRLMRGEGVVRTEQTRQLLAQVSAALSEYELDRGDYPPSSPPADLPDPPSATNVGAELLVLSLFGKDWNAGELGEEHLVNSDSDQAKESRTSFTSRAWFELGDSWENPIAYFHRRDYARAQVYLTFDPKTGEASEQEVRAALHPATGDPWNRSSFQLLSAGEDGRFGTEDDIGNFEP